MASDLSSVSTAPNSASPPRAVAASGDRFVDEQLRRVAIQIRSVDLIGGLIWLLIGSLVFVLAVVVIDHWIWPLGTIGRVAAFVAFAAGVGYGVARIVAPLLLRQINPVFAARVVERRQPTLRNSLVNFLMLRGRTDGLRPAVYAALERRAAADLSGIDIDMAVDRSRLFIMGYALAFVFALSAAYTVLSPKSVAQSVRRVLIPWSSVAAPSRVRIENIEPGNTTIIAGDVVDVSARVLGLRSGERPSLVFSTRDGQIVDRAMNLEFDSATLRHRAVLTTDGSGLRHDVRYRISAGDATSEEFAIAVQMEPTIVVERVEYEFPAYMQRPDYTAERQADIKGIDGATVTLHARANYPISSARIEFDPDSTSEAPNHRPANGLASANRGAARPRTPLPMQVDGTAAQVRFPLQWNAARQAGEHASYQIRFTTADGVANPHPTLHRIAVTPDLPPEIQILAPADKRSEVAEDGRILIEVRAIDPDFALHRVALRGAAGNEVVLDERLLDASDKAIGDSNSVLSNVSGDGATGVASPRASGHVGQYIGRYWFEPARLGLTAGSRVVLHAVAEDNRRDVDDRLAPNATRTADYEIIVVPAKSSASPAGAGDSTDVPEPNDESSPRQGEQANEDAADSRDEDSANRGGSDPSNPQPGDSSGENGGKDNSKEPANEGSADSKDDDPNSDSESSKTGRGGPNGGGGKGPRGEGANQGGTGSEGQEGDASENASDGASGTRASDSPNNQRGSGSRNGEPSSSDSPGSDGTASGTDRGDAPHPNDTNSKAGRGTPPGAGDPGQEDAGTGASGNDSRGNRAGGRAPSPQSTGETGAQQPANPNDSTAGSEGEPAAQPDSSAPNNNDSSGDDSSGSKTRNADPSNNAERGSSGGRAADPSEVGDSSVPRRPQHDGEAFERIQRYREQQEGSGSASGERQDANGAKGGDDSARGGAGESRDSANSNEERRDVDRDGPSGANAARPNQGDSRSNTTSASGREAGDSPNAGRREDTNSGRSDAPSRSQNTPSDKPNDSSNRGGEDSGKPASQGANSDRVANDNRGEPSGGDDTTGDKSGDVESGSGQPNSNVRRPGNEDAGTPSNRNRAEQDAGSRGDSSGDATPVEQGSGSGGSAGGPSGQSSTNANRGDDRNEDRGNEPGSKAGLPTGGEAGTDGSGAPSTDATDVPDGDDPNLEYARRATDLVLDYLEQQEERPDPRLLDELGWSESDLRKFVERWKKAKDAADSGDRTREADLDDALRSLGLRPPSARTRRQEGSSDAVRGLRQSSGGSQPPSKYRDRFDAFRKGAARSN